MKKNNFLLSIVVLLTISLIISISLNIKPQKIIPNNNISNTVGADKKLSEHSKLFHQTSYNNATIPQKYIDFTTVAKNSVESVVHIKTIYNTKPTYYDDYFNLEDFLEGRIYSNRNKLPKQIIASGSGVIISDDGYIVTNNHVVADADNIQVTLNDKRTYEATIIGTDPSTDLALIKIDEKDLSFINYGNSNEVQVGEWVLAIGNPFNLTSTVTAGIVSAKARNINVLGGNTSNNIESFIQTDAAVNKGNSGGALVNSKGELIGINAAIASRTGFYEGYSFAIPVNIVRKVVDDLLQFGEVQRAYIGVSITELNADLARNKGIDNISGVYINDVTPAGPADNAGIEAGDVILSIDGIDVNTSSELLGVIGQYRPGKKISIKINRKNNTKTYEILLTDENGNTEYIKHKDAQNLLGAKFKKADPKELRKLGLGNGVKIERIQKGSVLYNAGIKEGFIVVEVDNKPVKTAKDISKIIKMKKGGILFSGMYPNGIKAYYGFGIK